MLLVPGASGNQRGVRGREGRPSCWNCELASTGSELQGHIRAHWGSPLHSKSSATHLQALPTFYLRGKIASALHLGCFLIKWRGWWVFMNNKDQSSDWSQGFPKAIQRPGSRGLSAGGLQKMHIAAQESLMEGGWCFSFVFEETTEEVGSVTQKRFLFSSERNPVSVWLCVVLVSNWKLLLAWRLLDWDIGILCGSSAEHAGLVRTSFRRL